MSRAPLDECIPGSTYHWILTNEDVPGTLDSCLNFIFDGKTKEVINPAAFNPLFELNFTEHKNILKHGLSKEERKFLEIAEQGVHRREDGHYELPLPLKNRRINLPNNKNAALHRLTQLKRRFQSTNGQKYYTDNVEFMNKLVKNGYAEMVQKMSEFKCTIDDQTGTKRNVWYIPHHPEKPHKIRVVFYCAAECEGESLNKHLLQGPDLTNSLTGMLCRFRQEPIAFICQLRSNVPSSGSQRGTQRFITIFLVGRW